jgi:hypothetical protein
VVPLGARPGRSYCTDAAHHWMMTAAQSGAAAAVAATAGCPYAIPRLGVFLRQQRGRRRHGASSAEGGHGPGEGIGTALEMSAPESGQPEQEQAWEARPEDTTPRPNAILTVEVQKEEEEEEEEEEWWEVVFPNLPEVAHSLGAQLPSPPPPRFVSCATRVS